MTDVTPDELLPAGRDAGAPLRPEPVARHRSLRSDVWRQFRRHRGAMAGLLILTLITLTCFVGPLIYGVDHNRTDTSSRSLGVSWSHPLGTDNIGRDVLARVMVGGRISLAVGLTAMLVGVAIGTSIGVLSGFFRRLDGWLMRLTDMFLALPVLPLLLVVLVMFRNRVVDSFGEYWGTFVLVVGTIGVTSWMITARVVRSQVLAIKQKDFVLAAESIGSRKRNIIFRHIVPNVLSPVMVAAALGVAGAIITESALSFLGLGFPIDYPTWGRLLFDAKDYLRLSPARVIGPGLMISMTVISITLIGDGLRDALDPKLRSK